jgi:hypothetical protein
MPRWTEIGYMLVERTGHRHLYDLMACVFREALADYLDDLGDVMATADRPDSETF